MVVVVVELVVVVLKVGVDGVGHALPLCLSPLRVSPNMSETTEGGRQVKGVTLKDDT